MVRALFGVLLVVAPSVIAAQQGRALRIEDFYRLRSAGSVELSPDGRWVAFAVTARREVDNTEPSEVWVGSTDGAVPASRVSEAGEEARTPRWEGGRLRFRVKDGERTWDPATRKPLPDLARPSATPADRAAGGVSIRLRPVAVPVRSPDPVTEFERRHEERFKGVQFDWLDFQRDGQPFPVPNRADPSVSPPQEIWASTGGAERQLTTLGLRPAGLHLTRDGRHVVFTADTGYRNERRYGASAVYVVSLDGKVQVVTDDPDVNHSGALASPDGRWVLYTRQLSTDAVIRRRLTHGGATDLAIRPITGGPERVLTADWDYLPTNATWSPDGRFVYFQGGVGGTTHLFRVPAAGGPVEQVTRGERRLQGISIDSAYTTIAYLVGMIEAPADVWVARIDGTGERRITDLHQELTREVQLSRAERLRFTSRDSTPVEGWLMVPHGYRADGRRYPLVVMNHGGPHAADGYAFDFKSQYFAANGYFVLKVNFRSSTGYGEKFLWGTWGAWGDRDGEDVMAGIDHAIARFPIDRARVATMGHSYGGFMTNWLITQYPDRFAAAIPGAGIVNWVSDYGTADIARTKETEFFGAPWDEMAREVMIRQSPLTWAHRAKAPTLFVHGEVDQRVPYSEAEQMYVALKKNGVPARMIQYAGMAHGITGSWNQVHRALNELRWLDRWMGSGAQ